MQNTSTYSIASNGTNPSTSVHYYDALNVNSPHYKRKKNKKRKLIAGFLCLIACLVVATAVIVPMAIFLRPHTTLAPLRSTTTTQKPTSTIAASKSTSKTTITKPTSTMIASTFTSTMMTSEPASTVMASTSTSAMVTSESTSIFITTSTTTISTTTTPNQTTACSLAAFRNGDFETGNLIGWNLGGGSRMSLLWLNLIVQDYLPNGNKYNLSLARQQLQIVRPGQDPILSNLVPNIVFRGNYALKVGDGVASGAAAAVSQRIDDYYCDDIYFAWLAVLESSHNEDEASIVIIELRDITQGDMPIRKAYSAASSSAGIASLFNSSTGSSSFQDFYYTKWIIEHLQLNGTRRGHSFVLNILAADCSQSGHVGYVYLDGFGGTAP